jgi:hypothetical protein
MPGITTEFLFEIALEVPVLALGETPYGERRVARFEGGSFEGPKLRGSVLPGGGGWMLLRRDGVLDIEVRIVLETNDKQMIYMHWKGFRHGPKQVIDRLNRGEVVDPSSYYFRTTPYFETSSEKYSWLNRICSVATGSRVSATSELSRLHSISLSARTSKPGGIVRPRALAVFKLIMNSNLVGCSIGNSAGLAPFNILAT